MAVGKLLSVTQVATRLSVHRNTVYDLIQRGNETRGKDGIWPTYRIGKAIRVPETVVDAYLEASVTR